MKYECEMTYRMRDTHQHGDLLLQAFRLGAVFDTDLLAEDLDGIALTGGLFDAEEYLGKVALSKLLKKGITLQETTCLLALWISEDESCLVQYSNLVVFLKLSSLVSANNSFINECAIARQVLQNHNCLSTFDLGEQKAVSVRDNGIFDDEVFWHG